MIQVKGLQLDSETRCQHYHGPQDIVSLKMKCCQIFYACVECHHALCSHPVQRWQPHEYDQLAIRCGACGHLMSIREYRLNRSCTNCPATFNPRCRNHDHYYFAD